MLIRSTSLWSDLVSFYIYHKCNSVIKVKEARWALLFGDQSAATTNHDKKKKSLSGGVSQQLQ